MPRKAKEAKKKDTIEKNVLSPKREKETPIESQTVNGKKVVPKEKKTTSTTLSHSSTKTKKTTSAKTQTKKKQTISKESATKTKKATIQKRKPTSKQPRRPSSLVQDFKIEEYYDLPYRYEQTMVKILAQTPTTLFIYWEIAEEFIKQCKKEYGELFFEKTKPVLVIHNETKNYTFEVEINDFANCWYIQIGDSNCKYKIELGRRPKQYSTVAIPNNYLYVSSSNEIEAPNDHILFDLYQNTVYFRNVKTNSRKAKSISQFSFMKRIGKLQKFYQKLYEEDISLLNDLSNPSSQNPTSTFR